MLSGPVHFIARHKWQPKVGRETRIEIQKVNPYTKERSPVAIVSRSISHFARVRGYRGGDSHVFVLYRPRELFPLLRTYLVLCRRRCFLGPARALVSSPASSLRRYFIYLPTKYVFPLRTFRPNEISLCVRPRLRTSRTVTAEVHFKMGALMLTREAKKRVEGETIVSRNFHVSDTPRLFVFRTGLRFSRELELIV